VKDGVLDITRPKVIHRGRRRLETEVQFRQASSRRRRPPRRCSCRWEASDGWREGFRARSPLPRQLLLQEVEHLPVVGPFLVHLRSVGASGRSTSASRESSAARSSAIARRTAPPDHRGSRRGWTNPSLQEPCHHGRGHLLDLLRETFTLASFARRKKSTLSQRSRALKGPRRGPAPAGTPC
jgi:hypothetical protein